MPWEKVYASAAACGAGYFRTMVEVVHHLHQLGVMHRDIKPENFLLTTAGDDAVLKLCDFGLSAYWRAPALPRPRPRRPCTHITLPTWT